MPERRAHADGRSWAQRLRYAQPLRHGTGRGVAVDGELAAVLGEAQALASADGRNDVSLDDLLRCVDGPAPRAGVPARITPYRDGPYLVRGPFVIADQDGTEIDASRRTVALCRCGRSQIRPFCDGTHKLVGFQAPSGPATPRSSPQPGSREPGSPEPG